MVDITKAAYLTAEEAAGILRVSTRTIWRWVAADELEHVRFGNTIRIPVSAVRPRIAPDHGDEGAGAT